MISFYAFKIYNEDWTDPACTDGTVYQVGKTYSLEGDESFDFYTGIWSVGFQFFLTPPMCSRYYLFKREPLHSLHYTKIKVIVKEEEDFYFSRLGEDGYCHGYKIVEEIPYKKWKNDAWNLKQMKCVWELWGNTTTFFDTPRFVLLNLEECSSGGKLQTVKYLSQITNLKEVYIDS